MWGRKGRLGRWSRDWIEPEISLDPLAVDSHAGLRLPEGTRSSPPTVTVLREMALFNYRLIYRRNETITNFYQDGPLARPRARRAWSCWATRPKTRSPEARGTPGASMTTSESALNRSASKLVNSLYGKRR